MSTTITLKNIPDEIYSHLKQTAAAHHRSINSEAIACLERVLLPGKIGTEEHLARARKIRATLTNAIPGSKRFKASDITNAIKEGRA